MKLIASLPAGFVIAFFGAGILHRVFSGTANTGTTAQVIAWFCGTWVAATLFCLLVLTAGTRYSELRKDRRELK